MLLSLYKSVVHTVVHSMGSTVRPRSDSGLQIASPALLPGVLHANQCAGHVGVVAQADRNKAELRNPVCSHVHVQVSCTAPLLCLHKKDLSVPMQLSYGQLRHPL